MGKLVNAKNSIFKKTVAVLLLASVVSVASADIFDVLRDIPEIPEIPETGGARDLKMTRTGEIGRFDVFPSNMSLPPGHRM